MHRLGHAQPILRTAAYVIWRPLFCGLAYLQTHPAAVWDFQGDSWYPRRAHRARRGQIVPPDSVREHGKCQPTCRYSHTATLAWASTVFAIGVSSKWKNLIMFPAR